MNLKTMLLASAATLFAAQANATDITNPFYLPTEGHFLSETNLETNRTHIKKTEDQNTYAAAETLAYGLTDNWSVYGTLANYFMHDAPGLNNDHNFEYTLGTAYNLTHGKWLVQLSAEYNTYDPRTWVGKRNTDWFAGNNRWHKELGAGIKVGYEAGCGFTPYATFDVNGNIDDADRALDYSAFVGAHKQVDKVAVDGGVRYDFTTDKGYYEGSNEEWRLEADVDYYVRDNVTVGAYGSYYLGGEGRHDVAHDYTLGLALKVAF